MRSFDRMSTSDLTSVRISRIPGMLLLIVALISAPLLPAFAQVSAEASAHASACADAHAQHADPSDTAAVGCLQDSCASACCATCAHGFFIVADIETVGPARVSVFTATLPTGHITLIPTLLERPPRFPA